MYVVVVACLEHNVSFNVTNKNEKAKKKKILSLVGERYIAAIEKGKGIYRTVLFFIEN